MDNIAIIHIPGKSKPLDLPLSDISHLRWETCLRQIVFLPSHETNRISGDFKILSERQAFAELLEIICGLQSPVLGETQVLGQFKNFLREHQQAGHPLVLRFWGYFQALLNEAKGLREQNRGLLNSAGYGSITRKLLKNSERVALIGSGELAEEIYALTHKSARCSVYTRNIQKDFLGATLNPLTDIHENFDAVVVAAPVSNQLLNPHLSKWKLVIDWRAEDSLPSTPASVQYLPIRRLFEIHEEEKRLSQLKAQEIRDVIAKKSEAFFERVNIRPQGWDDVCA